MVAQLSNCWWIFVLLGLFAGIVSGGLGLGSGAIVVPTLVLVFSFKQQSAQGTALAVMVPMTLLGALRYWRNPNIDMNFAIIGLIILGAFVGVLIGTELAGRLPGPTLRKIFAIVITIVAVKMFTASPKPQPQAPGVTLDNKQNTNLVETGGINNESEQQ